MSFDQDLNEQANISGADLAIMVDEMQALKAQRDTLLVALKAQQLELSCECKNCMAAHGLIVKLRGDAP